MSWRDYVDGAVTAGPIEVHCCNNRRVCVWWRDNRPGWQMYAGRSFGTKRMDSQVKDRRETGITGFTDRLTVRMQCANNHCRRDVQRRLSVVERILDGLWAHNVERVSLSALQRHL